MFCFFFKYPRIMFQKMHFLSGKIHWNVHPAKYPFTPWSLETWCCSEEVCQGWLPETCFLVASKDAEVFAGAHSARVCLFLVAWFIHTQLPRHCCPKTKTANHPFSLRKRSRERYLKAPGWQVCFFFFTMETYLRSQINIRMLPCG